MTGNNFLIEVNKTTQGFGILVVRLQVINAEIAFFGFFVVHKINDIQKNLNLFN